MVLISVLMFVLWSTAAIGVGRVIVPVWQWKPIERLSLCWTAGTGLLALPILVTGLLGYANPVAIWCFGIGVPGILGWALTLRKQPATLAECSFGSLNSGKLILVGITLLVFLLAATAAIAPPGTLEWDTLSYHFAVPNAYLRAGRIYFIPYDHHSNFPFTMQMGYLAMLSAKAVPAAKWLHTTTGLTLCVSIAATARRIWPATMAPSIGAVVVILGTPMVFWEMTVGYVDLATTVFTWMSLSLLILLSQTESEASPCPQTRMKMLVASAVLMGCALGTKMTVLLFWGFALAGMAAYALFVRRSNYKLALQHGAIWGGTSLVVGLPWYVKTYFYTGSPVYPYFYGLFGGRYWTTEHAARYALDQAAFGLGKKPVDAILAPWNIVYESMLLGMRPWIFTEYVPFGLAPTVVVGLVALVWCQPKLPKEVISCLAFGAGIGASWFVLMQQTRYLLPGLPCAAIGCGALMAHHVKSIRFTFMLIAAVSLAVTLGRAAPLVTSGIAIMRGANPDEEAVRRTGPLARASFWINQNTPSDTKVALFDEVRGYYIDRQVLWAEPNHAAGLLPWNNYGTSQDLSTDLARRGFTIVLINNANRSADKGSVTPRWRDLVDDAIATGKFRELAQFGRYTQETIVYAVQPQ